MVSLAEDEERLVVPEGDFDVTWPAEGESMDEFAWAVCDELAAKGYCVIRTFSLADEDREELLEQAEEAVSYHRMVQEVEAAFLGFDNQTKVGYMPLERSLAGPDASEGEAVPALDSEAAENREGEAKTLLEKADRQITALGSLLTPLTGGSMGFTCHGRLAAFARMSLTRNDEDELPHESLADMFESEDWGQHVEEYIRFQLRRRLCFINMLENRGGDIWLYPKVEWAFKSARFTVSPNRLLVFRHDILDYSYQVMGPSLAVQSWFITEGVNTAIKEMQVYLRSPDQIGEVVVNPGPAVPDGPKASIMALTTRLPGEAWAPSQYWNMFAAGTDSCSQWPYCRWDTDTYYQEGADAIATGKSYTCHGGFVSQEQITQFDNEFFGISYDEARAMLPGQRMSLEVGYQVLVASGFNKKTLARRRIGSWYGDVGPDWHSFQTEWAKFCTDLSPTVMGPAMHNAVTAARISHIFDLKGPVSSYDTACSASLVAMNAAHLLMFDADPPGKDNSEALVVGVNTLLGPSSFIGNCMATMLSHQGRSFTFNRSADGYQRGEGCGAVFIKLFEGDRTEERERVAALIGTATNQDGRSASLTAPNGPAQQAVIKKSMAFAGINPNTVSIAECHGTGTALGDPIEVGALMAVMAQRQFPILKTSAKSNIAHLEAGAGIAGLTKCIMMINMCVAPPNCHLNCINAHLTIEGYPVYFDSELIDTGFSSIYCGVSSFGFGGTNSRADVYGYASKGHKQSIRLDLPRINVPREQPIGQPLFLCGSWSEWKDFEEMEGGRDGVYTASVTLGESLCEEFVLSFKKDRTEVFHPLIPQADQDQQIVGPDWDAKGLHFMIDGRRDGALPGTVYDVVFRWTDWKKSLQWFPADAPAPRLVGDLAPEALEA